MTEITPEMLKQMIELGGMDEQSSDLDAQLAQAQALANPIGDHHTTAGGAALGGLGDIIRGLQGGLQEKGLRSQKDELQKKKSLARQLYAQQLMGSFGGGAPQPAAPAPSFGGGGMGPVMGGAYGAGPYGYNPGGGQ